MGGRPKKIKNNQHSEFANGHPLNYYSSGIQLELPERTGRLMFCILWSIAKKNCSKVIHILERDSDSHYYVPIADRGGREHGHLGSQGHLAAKTLFSASSFQQFSFSCSLLMFLRLPIILMLSWLTLSHEVEAPASILHYNYLLMIQKPCHQGTQTREIVAAQPRLSSRPIKPNKHLDGYYQNEQDCSVLQCYF
jgi:hypothetical protein